MAAQWASAAAAFAPPVARMLRIPTKVPSPGVLLTFDDGPHPAGTPAVLEALDALRAPAVFFVTGENAARYPQLLHDIVDAGHEVGLHGHRHLSRLQWSRRLLMEDSRRALDVVSAAGVAPRLYRPPHGVFTLTGLRVVRLLGLTPLLWSRWARDWEQRASPRAIARRVSSRLETGDVLLLHDSDRYAAPGCWRATVAALPLIAENIAAAGLAPLPRSAAEVSESLFVASLRHGPTLGGVAQRGDAGSARGSPRTSALPDRPRDAARRGGSAPS